MIARVLAVLAVVAALLLSGSTVQPAVAASAKSRVVKSLFQRDKLGPYEAMSTYGFVFGNKNERGNPLGSPKRISGYHYRFFLGRSTTVDVVKPNPLVVADAEGKVYSRIWYTMVSVVTRGYPVCGEGSIFRFPNPNIITTWNISCAIWLTDRNWEDLGFIQERVPCDMSYPPECWGTTSYWLARKIE